MTPEVYVTGPQWFVLESVSPEGCVGRDSTFIDVFYPLYVPNAFTPNNDGVNDAFFVEGVEARGYRLEIYNRWGDLLFYSEDPSEPWIGNYQVQDWIILFRMEFIRGVCGSNCGMDRGLSRGLWPSFGSENACRIGGIYYFRCTLHTMRILDQHLHPLFDHDCIVVPGLGGFVVTANRRSTMKDVRN